MAGKVFFSVSMSLDGYIAPESVPVEDLFAPRSRTTRMRDPWERPGGTTFHFVNDGIEAALDQAREAAGDRDVRIAGGGATILEYVNAGLIDEFSIALSPVLFGSGIRLFEGVDVRRVALEPVRAEPSARVTHLTYAVRPR
jgi:dihydrofolate reductase